MAKKVSGYTRMNISLPEDVKQRMDRTKDDVNWSALAVQAFESKLAEIAAKKVKKNMDDVIQRLRASKAQSESECFQQGYEAGQSWAKDDAEAIELQRLDKSWDQGYLAYNAYSVAEAVQPTPRDEAPSLSFWEEALGDFAHEANDDDFVRGFVRGALDLWAEIKAKL
jgi:hypothetical protein